MASTWLRSRRTRSSSSMRGARFAKEISDGRLTVLEVGIAEGEGEATFWICDDKSEWSSFDPALAGRNGSRHRAISVRLRPFQEILQEYGVPYYCKIDIEGNDHLVVSAMTPESRPAFISAEVSERRVARPVCGLGYDRFKLVHQQSLARRMQRFRPSRRVRRIGNWPVGWSAGGAAARTVGGSWLVLQARFVGPLPYRGRRILADARGDPPAIEWVAENWRPATGGICTPQRRRSSVRGSSAGAVTPAAIAAARC